MGNIMNKRGFFFTLDIVIGVTLLVAGILWVYSFSLQEPLTQPALQHAEEIMAILINTRIKDISFAADSPVAFLLTDGRIYDHDKTLLSQLGEFFFLRSMSKEKTTKSVMERNMEQLLDALFQHAVPPRYGWAIRITNPQDNLSWEYAKKKRETTKTRVVIRQLSFGTYQQQTPYGPYVVEAEVWA